MVSLWSVLEISRHAARHSRILFEEYTFCMLRLSALTEKPSALRCFAKMATASEATLLPPASGADLSRIRKLASVQRIGSLQPIAGADKILAAGIRGWTCVVAIADGYAVGDHVAYFEIDSLLPLHPAFEFLRGAGCYARVEGIGEGYRIKTRKLRGVISQGLVMPLASLAGLLGADPETETPEGTDLTSALGVLKYEVLDVLPHSNIAGIWPAFLCKTDQERVQNVWTTVSAAAATGDSDEQFEVTLKLDGTSCTAFHAHGEIGVCSRNFRIKLGEEGGMYSQLGEPIAQKLAERGLNVAIQAEIMGPKIQLNREGLVEHQLFVFDVWDIDAQAYWDARRRRALCSELGLTHVPVIAEAMGLAGFAGVPALLAFAERPSLAHKIAEGVVFKSLRDPGVSFKAISQTFLLASKH